MSRRTEVIAKVPQSLNMGTSAEDDSESKQSISKDWETAKLRHSEFDSQDKCDECRTIGEERLPGYIDQGRVVLILFQKPF